MREVLESRSRSVVEDAPAGEFIAWLKETYDCLPSEAQRNAVLKVHSHTNEHATPPDTVFFVGLSWRNNG